MKNISLAILSATLIAASAPAFASKADCDAGYKNFLKKMSTYVDTMTAYDLSEAISKSLTAYNTCSAGDSFSTKGVWDQIAADMQTKAGK